MQGFFQRSQSNYLGTADNAGRIESELSVEDKNRGNERREQTDLSQKSNLLF